MATISREITEQVLVQVNCEIPLKRAIREGGWEWHPEDFPSIEDERRPSGTRKLDIVRFDAIPPLDAEEIIQEIKGMRCRPGTIQELLAMASERPDLPREGETIFALGSVGQYWVAHDDEDGRHNHGRKFSLGMSKYQERQTLYHSTAFVSIRSRPDWLFVVVHLEEPKGRK